jgi:hypothetical protein
MSRGSVVLCDDDGAGKSGAGLLFLTGPCRIFLKASIRRIITRRARLITLRCDDLELLEEPLDHSTISHRRRLIGGNTPGGLYVDS